MNKRIFSFSLFLMLLASPAIISSSPKDVSTRMIVGVSGPWSGTSEILLNERDFPNLLELGTKFLRLDSAITPEFVDYFLEKGFTIISTLKMKGLPNENEFAQYVFDTVTQFKGKIEGWIVFNEINTWTESGWDFSPSEYLKLLRIADNSIKLADPDALTISSNFLYADRATDYVKELYILDPDFTQYFDVFAIDPYCYPVSPEEPNIDEFGHGFWEIRELMNFLKHNCIDKPVWIMEVGWPTVDYRDPPFDEDRVISEELQAEYLKQAFNMAYAFGVERFYIYKWMDSSNLHCMGLIRESYSSTVYKKPAFYTVKELIKKQPID